MAHLTSTALEMAPDGAKPHGPPQEHSVALHGMTARTSYAQVPAKVFTTFDIDGRRYSLTLPLDEAIAARDNLAMLIERVSPRQADEKSGATKTLNLGEEGSG